MINGLFKVSNSNVTLSNKIIILLSILDILQQIKNTQQSEPQHTATQKLVMFGLLSTKE